MNKIYEQTRMALIQLLQTKALTIDHILVVGTSTSEVAGKKIGSGGSLEIAAAIFKAINELALQHGFHLAFQCCEHLNRALVVERRLQSIRGYDEVTVKPIETAGGSMATYAYRNMKDAVLIEHVRADAGIDIGETMIGMHLKHVAVPVRYANPFIGQARVLLATTRPKLIGGQRASYN